MTHDQPLLTICIPVFNGQQTIATAVDSALGLQDISVEVLVSDNASTDATPTICRRYGEAISYRRNATNLGFAGNYKQCLKAARGQYLYFMGADDVIDGAAVLQLVRYLDDHPSVALVSSNLWYFRNDSKQRTRSAIYFQGKAATFTAGEDALCRWLFYSVLGSIGGYLLRASVTRSLESSIPTTSITPQLHLAAALALHYPVAHLPCFSMGQRMTDNTTQLANKNYLSLSPVYDCLALIDRLTSRAGPDRLPHPARVQQKLVSAYLQGLVWNIVSYRSFGSAQVHRSLLKLLARRQPTLFFHPMFLLFSFATLILPRTVVRHLLRWHRNGRRESTVT